MTEDHDALKIDQIDENYRLHYQVLMGDIRESKTDQWRISNYGLLAQAAVASVFSALSEPPTNWVAVLFGLLVVVICGCAIWLIRGSWELIKRCREEAELYPEPYNPPKGRYSEPERQSNDRRLLWLFRGIQTAGAVMAVLFVFRAVIERWTS